MQNARQRKKKEKNSEKQGGYSTKLKCKEVRQHTTQISMQTQKGAQANLEKKKNREKWSGA